LGIHLPRLYVVLDSALLSQPAADVAARLMDAGVRALQYRAKNQPAREILSTARQLAQITKPAKTALFVNDRPDIAVLAEADGVHVGQDDIAVEHARSIVGSKRWVGVSTHNREQFVRAVGSSADYVAIGPIFATSSKANPDPVVGVELLRELRPLTKKPIVAIGGILLERAAEVIEAGADSVAVIRDILAASDPARRARQFLDTLEAAKAAAGR